MPLPTATAAEPDARDVPSELERIREAFGLFDAQSRQLQSTFDTLQKELAQANRELNAKNLALSQKVDELQAMTSRLHCILQSLTDGVLVVGRDLVVERCNAAAERLLGLPRSEIEGRPYAEVARDEAAVRAIEDALERGRTLTDRQRRYADAHGRTVEILDGVAPVLAPDGAILGAIEVLRDMTELRALEARVRHQERMAALGEMAASVAHEIRNPLGTIEGFARLLRRDLEDQPNHRRLADKIVQGAQNLNYVITNLLTYVRPMSLQSETFDAGRLLASAVEGLGAGPAARQVRVEVEPPEPPVAVHGDIRQLRQVLLNLGLNAVEASGPGQTVRLAAFRTDTGVHFQVRDEGCGIQADAIPRLFDPFFTTKQGGTGLGLSLCHKIVAAHNGRIDVQTQEGRGSTFEVILPHTGGRP
jgi:PAS domain S-box-containing protein